jgi:hypothetical protein
VRRPGSARGSGGALRTRGPALLEGGSLRDIPARETKPRHPGHGDGDLQISVGAARDPLRFAGYLEGALFVALRQPRPGERDIPQTRLPTSLARSASLTPSSNSRSASSSASRS